MFRIGFEKNSGLQSPVWLGSTGIKEGTAIYAAILKAFTKADSSKIMLSLI